MEVDDDFNAVLGCPVHRLREIGKLPLDVWLATRNIVSPITNWNADMIKASSCDSLKISFRDPRIPMVC